MLKGLCLYLFYTNKEATHRYEYYNVHISNPANAYSTVIYAKLKQSQTRHHAFWEV
jgi:hypothetical protein